MYFRQSLFLILLAARLYSCSFEEFESNVNGFAVAFDDAYTMEIPTTEVSEENEMAAEGPILEESSQNKVPVEEELVVTDSVFQPGSDVHHELNDEVRVLAEKVLAIISQELRLVNVTDAVSTVTDKVQRSLSMVVARGECEGDSEECTVSCRVELVSDNNIDEVVWHNCLDSANNNEVMRAKRGAIGGFKQVDEKEANELAEAAVQTLDSIDADDIKRVVVNVVRAQKQLVNGIMYHLTVEVASSDCREGNENEDCKESLSEPSICKILMQKHFIGEAPNNAQVIKSECTPISKGKGIGELKRGKRNIHVQNEDNEVGEQVSQEKPKIDSHGNIVGGIQREDSNTNKTNEISQFALLHIEKALNSANKLKVFAVSNVHSQVVAGTKYFMKIELVETDCRRGSEQESCNPVSDQATQACDVVVWDKPWKSFRAITKVDCAPVSKRAKRATQACDVVVWDKPWKGFRAITKVDCAPVSKRAKRGYEEQAPECSNHGTYKSGICECDSNYFGPKCECGIDITKTGENEPDLTAGCRPENTTLDCSGRGTCICGQCECEERPNTEEKISGQFCECDNFSCDRHNGLLCSGPDHGTCLCGKCVCHSDWTGSACDCPAKNDTCMHPAGGEICSGHGVCQCGMCKCDQDEQGHYSGRYCERSPQPKDVLVGGLSEADPKDPRVQEMAQFAVTQLDSRSNSNYAQKIVEIKRVQTQVVAGANYFMTLALIETDCQKGSPVNNSCNAAPGKVLQVCDVVVYDRPWDKHRELTSANCSSAPSNRAARSKETLVGGYHDVDPKDPDVIEMAEFARSQLDARSNSINRQKIVKVSKAETQVVAGKNYRLTLLLVETNCRKDSDVNTCSPAPNKVLQKCDVVVYDRPWDHHREMTSANCSSAPDREATRNKRDILVGGRVPANKDSDEIRDIAQFAVDELNKKSNSNYKQLLVEVMSAYSQIVSGVSYQLKIRVADSECEKESNTACLTKENPTYQECEVVVWSQPWLNKTQVTKSKCEPVGNIQASGAPKSVSPLDSEVLEAAKFSLKMIDSGSNSMYKHALIRVLNAKVQTVAGKKYLLTLEIGESECAKTQKEENCALRAENSLNEKCSVVIWDRPWISKKEVLNVQCGLRQKRTTIVEAVDLDAIHSFMFEEFKTKYNKSYDNEVEHRRRFRIFRANLKKIQILEENEQGTATYGPNMFADLTAKEFKRFLGLKPGPVPVPSSNHMVPAKIPDVLLPTELDWRDKGAVTPVKNQGQCGSCWAFSVTGNVEGQWFLKNGTLVSLSEQELVDCDKTDNGCEGGYMTQAYEAIEKIGGLESEHDYPYDAEDESCKFNKSEVKATVVSSVNITTNETQMAQWLFKNGPISIGINANAMQFYVGGVSHPLKFLCSSKNLDHGVLLVGFGIHRTSIRHKLLPYWLVKNSWGPHWGEKGYYRVYRGDGTCGVNQMASSAIIG